MPCHRALLDKVLKSAKLDAEPQAAEVLNRALNFVGAALCPGGKPFALWGRRHR